MSEERRRYIRISTVLPIEFFVFDREGKRITPWLQGFTQDISKGGLCLLINDLWWGFWDRFHNDNVLVSLKIHLPFKKNPLSGKAKVAWVNQKKLKDFNQYVVGLEFLQADKKKAANLFKYALLKKSLPLFVGGVIIILSLFSFSSFRKAKILIKENKNLVKEYVDILQRNTALGKIYENEKEGALHFRKRQKQMQERIDSKNKEVSRYQKNYESLLKAKLEDQLSLQKASQLKEKISLL
ncbi:MAG: PilZ domain-containing protein, partial [Candidatus Omnitrophica bacterium]|nr:PilZ domain-containing protein [Candidatus Omnitrophota bacterium]